MQDATVLARDIAGDAASKAASKVNPSEDELRNIDAPADDNTWHDTPDLSRDNLKQQFNDRKPFSRQDVKTAADKATSAGDQGDGVDARHGANVAADHLKGVSKQNVPEEDQQTARENNDRQRELRERGQNYVKTKFDQDRRDQTIWRLKKMVAEIQGHQDCKFNLISNYSHY